MRAHDTRACVCVGIEWRLRAHEHMGTCRCASMRAWPCIGRRGESVYMYHGDCIHARGEREREREAIDVTDGVPASGMCVGTRRARRRWGFESGLHALRCSSCLVNQGPVTQLESLGTQLCCCTLRQELLTYLLTQRRRRRRPAFSLLVVAAGLGHTARPPAARACLRCCIRPSDHPQPQPA